VTFRATLDDQSSGVYLWEDGNLTTVTDSSGPFNEFGPRPTLNDSGALAFTATLDNGESGVFIAEQGAIRTYVDTTGPYRHFGFDTVVLFSGPSINDAGHVAFSAGLDTGSFGIFTGPDPQADKVIARGDPLFGSFVVDVAFDWQGQNNAGQVAFAARLLDGRTVIARADWADNDLDGVLDVIEQGAPGGGDGNGDGISDRLQDNVASFRSAVGGSYLTLAAPPGTQLVDVEAASAPFPRPIGATFPFGVVGFELQGIAAGQAAQVDLIVPGNQTSHAYFKQNLVSNWYSFAFDGTTGAQAATDIIHANPVTRFALSLVDGNSRGDRDGTANGRIVDPGGPALVAVAAPPTVESVVINDGAAQRSMVNSFTVTFDRLMTVEPDAFEIRQVGGHGHIWLDVELNDIGGKTVARVSFAGGGVIGGSLADGEYTLTIRGDKICDALGDRLDGDGDGAAGGNHIDEFFRLYGDTNGDGDVDRADAQVFASALGKRSTSNGYLWYLDYHGNERIGVEDLAMFLVRFVKSKWF
jgi:hypothetical protein